MFETLVGSPVNCCCYVNDSVVACGTQDSTLHCVDLRVPRFAHILSLLKCASSGSHIAFFTYLLFIFFRKIFL